MNSQIRSFVIASIGIILIGILSDGVFGHSYVTSPISRTNQAQSNGGCRGPSCTGPCDAPKSRITRTPITAARGSTITVNWPRNNHAAGFIRIAWSPTDSSDSHQSFDNNVQEISCHERGGCRPDNANDPNGGDSGPGDGSRNPCSLTIVVPPHLTDGLWTMQWAWFGGAFALGDYYSCVDYKISGGASGSAPAPFFLGGDFSYPGQQKCKFFNTDRLHQCINEPCNNPVYPSSQEQSGRPFGFSDSVSPPPSSVTTGALAPITTGIKPATTGRLPVTTGQSNPNPGPATSTTGQSVPVPAPVPAGSNCAGATVLSTSTANIVQVDTWGSTVRAVIELRVRENLLANWNMQIIWPASAASTRIMNVYNAGTLSCEGTSPARHAMIRPVANWATNLAAGTVLQIEIFATNSGLSRDFFQANTEIRVFQV